MSAIILFALPILLGLVLYRMNPEYIGLLFTDPIGHTMLMVGSALMVIGAFVTRKDHQHRGVRTILWIFQLSLACSHS